MVPCVMQLLLSLRAKQRFTAIVAAFRISYVYACVCTSMNSRIKCALIRSDANTRGQRKWWFVNGVCSHLTPLGTCIQLCIIVNGYTCWHMQEYFLAQEKLGYSLSLSFPFIPRDNSQPFTPRHHFHFIHSLSHHFPSFLLSSLTPFPHSYSFSFFFYFHQHSVSQLSRSSLSLPPSLLPSVLYLCLCHHQLR